MNGNSPAADFKNNNAISSAADGRTGSRSVLKTTSRTQNASKASAADGTVTTKHNQSKEHAEKKKQAVTQLRRMLIQGNKRVEALATVIQHIFSEVLWLNQVGRYCRLHICATLASGGCVPCSFKAKIETKPNWCKRISQLKCLRFVSRIQVGTRTEKWNRISWVNNQC